MSVDYFSARAGAALSRRTNWIQLVKFCLVGSSGYVVNLSVYTALLEGLGVHFLLAAVASFLVAVTNNYTWNRHWTFRNQRGHLYYQYLRFVLVSLVALGANLALLALLVGIGVPKIPAQAVAIVLVTPFSFLANKMWSFQKGPGVTRPNQPDHSTTRVAADIPDAGPGGAR